MTQPNRSFEKKAQIAESKISCNGTSSSNLAAAIESAELYMKALRISELPSDRSRLNAKCAELIGIAERLKSAKDESSAEKASREDIKYPTSTRRLTTRENIILLEGSRLNGFIFKPWVNPPLGDEFIPTKDHPLFSDSAFLPLSPAQQQSFAGWKRPREAFSQIQIETNDQMLPNDPCMFGPGKVDLVQDMTSDCSVVASLCSATSRAERGHRMILGTVFWPYDHEQDRFLSSLNGRYILCFYFNGCWRKIEIDDNLPTSTSPRLMHVIDRSHPGLLWPALVEKAYLKVRGGYDFPGSNSGTDLAVLTGWIPQQLFLQHQEIVPQQLWSEVATAFQKGDVLLTIGTGKMARRERKHLGLAPEHDYAVLEMRESGNSREMLVKNPWADGDVWKGAVLRRSQQNQNMPLDNSDVKFLQTMMPGTFWMDFNHIFQYFENMYLNWNPGLFAYREDIHFTWDVENYHSGSAIIVDNPQFVIYSPTNGQVWLLLNRHFRNGDQAGIHGGKTGYISLYLYAHQGQKILSNDGALIRGPFVDSPNTLLRFDLLSDQRYTVVVASQNLVPPKHNFTLSAFSHTPSTLLEAELLYKYKQTISAAWTRSSAGGNSDSANYLSNPQFSFVNHNDQKVAFVLRVVNRVITPTKETQIYVKILLVLNDGSRISRLRLGDAITSSGDYQPESAVIETTLHPGTYVLICSTFEENQLQKFELDCYSGVSGISNVFRIPSEASGRLKISPPAVVFTGNINRQLAPVTVTRITKAIFATLRKPSSSTSSLFKLTLEQGQGPYKTILASSGSDDEDYVSASAGLRIEDIDLHPVLNRPENGGLWLVLERLASSSKDLAVEEILQVEILVDERIELGAWGFGEG